MGRFISPNEIFGKISDSESRVPRIDSASHALKAIELEHSRLHDGNHFTYTQVDADFDIADAVELLIVAPNTTTWAHMIISVAAGLDTNVKLSESATHTVLAAQTAYNNNRNSATANTTTINTHNNDGADGTVIEEIQFGISTGAGANSNVGGGASRGDLEWLLKQNTKYLLVVTSGTDNSVLSIRISWYETVSKDI